MTTLELKSNIIYGPVNSRRLGRSLGVNLLSPHYKLCSFDCVYCHFGRTAFTTRQAQFGDLPDEERVLGAVEGALRARRDFDYLTFSGNGEPTLHPRFPAIAAGIRALRDQLRPDVKLTLLSNSTTAHLPHIVEALSLLDLPIMKLDAGDARTFARVNRPAADVAFEQIVAGLKRVPNLIVQSVLIDGALTNRRGDAFEHWLAALAAIKPTQVQIYSTDRPVPETGVEKVPPNALQHIAAEIERRTGLAVTAYWSQR